MLILTKKCEYETIFLNGVLCSAEAARIDPRDRGLLLGDGLFETIRIDAGKPRHILRHYARLRAGAVLLRLPLPFNEEAFNNALVSTIQANRLTDGALRLTLTRGPGPRGIMPAKRQQPTVIVTAATLAPIATAARVVVAQNTRRDETSLLSRIKSLNYLSGILARFEADDRGADDAILLNHLGFVAEASAANLFLYRQGKWLTPSVTDGALPGIRRQILIEAGVVHEARLLPPDLFEANALCLGNVLGLRPVSYLDGNLLNWDEDAFRKLQLI